MRRFLFMGLIASASAAIIEPVLAKGDLAAKGTKLPELVFGLGDAGFGVSQKEFALETGQLYQLVIKSTGNKECAVRGEKFFSSVYMRKVEVEDIEIKAPFFTELEFEQAGEAELFFVPIRPGKLTLACAGLEAQGMTVTFTVE